MELSINKMVLYYREKGERVDVGWRFKFLRRIGYKSETYIQLDTDSTAVCDYISLYADEHNMTKYTFSSIEGVVVNGIFTTRSEDNAYEVTEKNIKSVLEKITKSNSVWLKKNEGIQDSFTYYISELKSLLKDNNVSLSSESNVKEDDLCYATRFIGGFDAWSGDEDICDAEILDGKVRKNIQKAIREFNKRHKGTIRVDYFTSEKAWTYFNFTPVFK